MDEKTIESRVIDEELVLVPYFPNEAVTLGWYQDVELVRQVDNNDQPYTPELLRSMYEYLSERGNCYYIQYNGILVGDVTLQDSGELAIVVCREYQNRRIGRRCIGEMLRLAKEKGMAEVFANIYSFNEQSRRMFRSVGFSEVEPERFLCRLG